MASAISQPTFTTLIEPSRLSLDRHAIYVTGDGGEQRSEHFLQWEQSRSDVLFMVVRSLNKAEAIFTLAGGTRTVGLRNLTELQDALHAKSARAVYLDITGMSHHVWAPLLRALRGRIGRTFVIYAEPGDYRFSTTPTDVTLFDLSEKIEGISPLPGFARLATLRGDNGIFVPLLGFEGARLAFMQESVQSKREDIIPIIGVPGFRPEYVFYAYHGNRLKLTETRAWHNVRFAAANCPFAAYQILTEIAAEHPGRPVRIGLIGTKPHALGAVLFQLDNEARTELLHDHPIRRQNRTEGVSRICVYNLTLFH